MYVCMDARVVSIESVYPVDGGFEREGLLGRDYGSAVNRLNGGFEGEAFRVGNGRTFDHS